MGVQRVTNTLTFKGCSIIPFQGKNMSRINNGSYDFQHKLSFKQSIFFNLFAKMRHPLLKLLMLVGDSPVKYITMGIYNKVFFGGD